MTTPAADSGEPSDSHSEVFLYTIRRIGQVTKQNLEKEWREVVAQFDAIEPELVAICATEADKLEVRRRLSESILRLISTATPPPDRPAYECIWQRMCELGFTNSERFLSMLFFRLTYLIERADDTATIDSELAKFKQEVNDLLQKPDPDLGEQFSRVYERLLNKKDGR